MYRKGLGGNWVCLASVKMTSLHQYQKGLETNVMLVHSRWEGRKEGDKKIRNSGNRAAADMQQILWHRDRARPSGHQLMAGQTNGHQAGARDGRKWRRSE